MPIVRLRAIDAESFGYALERRRAAQVQPASTVMARSATFTSTTRVSRVTSTTIAPCIAGIYPSDRICGMLLGGGEDDRVRTDAASWATSIVPGDWLPILPDLLPNSSVAVLPHPILHYLQRLSRGARRSLFRQHAANSPSISHSRPKRRRRLSSSATRRRRAGRRRDCAAGRGDEFQGGACERAERRRRTGAFLAMHLGMDCAS